MTGEDVFDRTNIVLFVVRYPQISFLLFLSYNTFLSIAASTARLVFLYTLSQSLFSVLSRHFLVSGVTTPS